jgi:hypothetical protein
MSNELCEKLNKIDNRFRFDYYDHGLYLIYENDNLFLAANSYKDLMRSISLLSIAPMIIKAYAICLLNDVIEPYGLEIVYDKPAYQLNDRHGAIFRGNFEQLKDKLNVQKFI